MYKFLLDQVAKPMCHRIGTISSTAIVTYGLAGQETASQIGLGITAICGIAFDLISRRVL